MRTSPTADAATVRGDQRTINSVGPGRSVLTYLSSTRRCLIVEMTMMMRTMKVSQWKIRNSKMKKKRPVIDPGFADRGPWGGHFVRRGAKYYRHL